MLVAGREQLARCLRHLHRRSTGPMACYCECRVATCGGGPGMLTGALYLPPSRRRCSPYGFDAGGPTSSTIARCCEIRYPPTLNPHPQPTRTQIIYSLAIFRCKGHTTAGHPDGRAQLAYMAHGPQPYPEHQAWLLYPRECRGPPAPGCCSQRGFHIGTGRA